MATKTLAIARQDAARAMAAYHFRPTTLPGAFERLRSVQFDPLAPVGCNHDLVLQSRVPGYRIGDWKRTAYSDRLVFDSWDKQASLVWHEAWPAKRIFHKWWSSELKKIFEGHADAVQAVLGELRDRGPMTPKDFEFQEHKPEWKDSWYGPNLTKQVLRALWHTGQVMTSGRQGVQHVYDLAERVVPPEIISRPIGSEDECVRELVRDRHASVGLLRPNAPAEVWCIRLPKRTSVVRQHAAALVAEGELVAVDVEGMSFHASPRFVAALDDPAPDTVSFVAPLDQFVWDRKALGHLFGFDYLWEVYVPPGKRQWGYYVLPVLYGDRIVARCDVWCRNDVLETRAWHWEEEPDASSPFWEALSVALVRFLDYSGAKKATAPPGASARLKSVITRARPNA